MSRKKKKEPTAASGVYALSITAGLIVGLGFTPLMGNLVLMLVLGGLGGALAAFLITRNSPTRRRRRRH